MRNLSPKQKRLVDELVGREIEKGKCKTQIQVEAYKQAYQNNMKDSAIRTEVYRTLQKPHVKKYYDKKRRERDTLIKKKIEEKIENSIASETEVLEFYTSVMRNNIRNIDIHIQHRLQAGTSLTKYYDRKKEWQAPESGMSLIREAIIKSMDEKSSKS